MWFPVCDSSLMSRVEAAFARKQFHFHWCETDLDRDSSNYLQRNVQMHWMAIVKEDKIRMSNCVCVAISIYAAKEYNHLRLRRANLHINAPRDYANACVRVCEHRRWDTITHKCLCQALNTPQEWVNSSLRSMSMRYRLSVAINTGWRIVDWSHIQSLFAVIN